MAPFNPNVPERNEPNYLGYSKSITQPDGNKAAAFAGQAEAASISAGGAMAEGFGKLFATAVSGTDQVIKADIDNKIYTAVDKERNQYTDALELFKNGDPSKSPAMMAGGIENAPGQIQDLEYAVSNIQGGLDSGKLSHTFYVGQINTLAKDMRERYPGYKEYIDKTITNITGFNPANKYVESLLADINKNVSSAQAERGKATTFAKEMFKEGIVGHNVVAAAENGSLSVSGVAKEAAPIIQVRRARELRKQGIEDQEADEKVAARVAESDAQSLALERAMYVYNNFKKPGGKHTGAEIAKQVQDALMGVEGAGMSQQQALAHKANFEAIKSQAKAAVFSAYNQPDDKGNTIIKRLGTGGTEKSKKILEDTINTIFDDTSNNLAKGSVELVGLNSQFVKYAFEDFDNRIFNSDQKVANWFASMKFMQAHVSPELLKPWAVQKLGTFNSAFNAVQQQATMDVFRQPDPRRIATSTDVISTMQLKDPNSFNYKPEDYKQVVDDFKMLTKEGVTDPMKQNIVRGYFMGNARTFLDKFEQQDRMEVFQLLTTPESTKEIKRLDATSPGLWTAYTNWAQNSFGNKIFTQTLLDLEQFKRDPNVKITWDSEHHKLGLVVTGKEVPFFLGPSNRGDNASKISDSRVALIQDRIDYLNMGLGNLSEIQKAGGKGDMEHYLLDRMQKAGFDITGKVGGVPGQIIDAIIASRQQKPEGPQKASQSPSGARTAPKTENMEPGIPYSERSPAGSVEGWLKDPSMGKFKPTINLTDPSNGESVSLDVQDIPVGMSPEAFIKILKQRDKQKAQAEAKQ